MPNIYFPNFNLAFTIDRVAFEVFGLPIYWYGIILTSGILLGLLMAMSIAKKEGINPDCLLDFLLIDIVFAIIGARVYFVIFSWEHYMANPLEMFNLRKGGIAIYGAIIASIIVAIIYTNRCKINFWKFADICTFGLLIGQAIGRYGNFVNKEAFGDYTNSLFAMRILRTATDNPLTQTILDNIVLDKGLEYIQVHPTFLYESCWNIGILILLLIYRKYKKCNGEIFFFYLIGYGVGRFWIEGLRTDQLILPFVNIPASQVTAILSIVAGIGALIVCRKRISNSLLYKKM